jgi:hypothetical protein
MSVVRRVQVVLSMPRPSSARARVGPFSEHARIHVIIETPSGSGAKDVWNPIAEAMALALVEAACT